MAHNRFWRDAQTCSIQKQTKSRKKRLNYLTSLISDYGLPCGIVSDNGSVFTSDAFLDVLDGLKIQPCPIEAGQPGQNLIETQFNIQRRLADAKFIHAQTFEAIQDQHAAFIQLFNKTRHWAHRERTDDQWLKVMRRPPYAQRKSPLEPIARQLLLWGSA